jgi:hypothetical protein
VVVLVAVLTVTELNLVVLEQLGKVLLVETW